MDLRTAEGLAEILAGIVHGKASDISLNGSLRDQGFTSFDLVRFSQTLAETIGQPVPSDLVWRFPTLIEISNYLRHGTNLDQQAVHLAAPRAGKSVIVGLSCRLPGAADEFEFLRLLRDGLDTSREVPPDRWHGDAFYSPDASAPGCAITKRGHFLDDVLSFDAAFFGISKREADEMDPQQRLVLELVWEALENSGIVPTHLKGKRVGVFIGATWADYASLRKRSLQTINTYSGTGSVLDIIANRVSYFFGFNGASIVVDTACSSSLVACHLANRALSADEADLVIAGGVNLNLDPTTMVQISKFGALSPDGRCKTFGAAANGYGRGEGGGIVVMARQGDAARFGWRVRAHYLGSAINNDGRSNGMTAPNPEAQKSVYRAALADAGISPLDVDIIEAHGTGTALGDPIEIGSLKAVYTSSRDNGDDLLVGSVKSNIGHLESSAGIAGVIKCVLSMEQAVVAKSLHCEPLNPTLEIGNVPLRVANTTRPWPARGREFRTAAISSFGWGGTNCHAILQRPIDWDAVSTGSKLKGGSRGKSYLLFSGQGGEWTGMGRDLLSQNPVFHASVERSTECLVSLGAPNPIDLLIVEPEDKLQLPLGQIGLCVFQMAIWDVLDASRCQPSGFSGHSIGMIAASYAAGRLSRREALRVLARYVEAEQALANIGGMAVVRGDIDRIFAVISEVPDVNIAAVLSPKAVTLSGSDAGLSAAIERLRTARIPGVPARVRTPAHSSFVDRIAAQLLETLGDITTSATVSPLLDATGREIGDELSNPKFWVNNLRDPSDLVSLGRKIATTERCAIAEIGPSSVLEGTFGRWITSLGGQYASITRDAPCKSLDTIVKLLPRRAAATESLGVAICLSQMSESALKKSAISVAVALDKVKSEPTSIEALCCNVNARARHKFNMSVAANTAEEISEALQHFASGESRDLESPPIASVREPSDFRPVLVFSGQSDLSACWASIAGMGEAAIETLLEIEGEIFRRAGWSLRRLLSAEMPEEALRQTTYIQPALFAIQLALANQWKAWGISPAGVIGHSVGEWAAAVTANILNRESALDAVLARGRILDQSVTHGRMAAIRLKGISQSAASKTIETFGAGSVGVAAYNEPEAIVLSGPRIPLETVCRALQEAGTSEARFLEVDYAFHSPALSSLRQDLAAQFSKIEMQKTDIPFFSTVTGEILADLPADRDDYWERNVIQPVLFYPAIKSAARMASVFLEIAPAPQLSGAMLRTLIHEGLQAQVPVLSTRNPRVGINGSPRAIATKLSALGADINWSRLFRRTPTGIGPGVVWSKTKHWFESGAKFADLETGLIEPITLLPTAANGPNQSLFVASISGAAVITLNEHRVSGAAVLPAVLVLELLRCTAGIHLQAEAILQNVELREMLKITSSDTIIINVEVRSAPTGEFEMSLKARTRSGHDEWKTLATSDAKKVSPGVDEPEQEYCRTRVGTEISPERLYAQLQEMANLEYGESFRLVESVSVTDEYAWTTLRTLEKARQVKIENGIAVQSIDAALHAFLLLADFQGELTALPVAIEKFQVIGSPVAATSALLVLRSKDKFGCLLDIFLYDATAIIVRIEGLKIRYLKNSRERPVALGRFIPRRISIDIEPGSADVIVATEPACQISTDVRMTTIDELRSLLKVKAQQVIVLLDVSIFDDDDLDRFSTQVTDLIRQILGLDRVDFSAATILMINRRGNVDRLPNSSAGLSGLSRTLAQECIHIGVAYLSSDEATIPRAVLIAAARNGAVSSFRGGNLYASDYRQDLLAGAATDVSVLASNSSYLVVGGLGALGRVAVQTLLQQGARTVVVASRVADDSRQELLWRQIGDEFRDFVTIKTINAENTEELGEVFKDSEKCGRPIRGVIHAAGVLQDKITADLTSSDLVVPLRSKILITRNILKLASHYDTDFVILFSSITSILGSPGQANYAIGNAYQDACAQAAAAGPRVISINWPGWEGSGMFASASTATSHRWTSLGGGLLDPRDGQRVLRAAFGYSSGQIMVDKMDWSQFQSRVRAPVDFKPVGSSSISQNSNGIGDLSRLPRTEAGGRIKRAILEIAQKVLGVNDAIEIKFDASLLDQGLDSLGAQEMSALMSRRFNLELRPTFIFNTPDITAMAEHIQSLLLPLENESKTEGMAVLSQIQARLSALEGTVRHGK